ncbi:hypothetical protein [Nocardia sp. CA-290969]|uniref:hypothetical protein n=1 Tax=Nocardia sp. CA-290969 TaxID=3239986 RepID=UPI003D8F4844
MDIDNGLLWPMHGARWTAYEYRNIIAGLQRGDTWEEIAKAVGRTVSAVRSRADYLIERNDGVRGPRRRRPYQRLEDRIAIEPDYDWESVARRKHAEAELPYWDETADDYVRAVWSAAPAPGRWGWLRRGQTHSAGMSALSSALRVSEADIADRIVELGLSSSYADIADRLGCTPDGALALRAGLARAEDPSTQCVLVAAGEFGEILHVSLHGNRDEAENARVAVESRLARKGPVMTRIVRRVPGRLFGGDPTDDKHSHAASRNHTDEVVDAVVEESAPELVGVVNLDQAELPEKPAQPALDMGPWARELPEPPSALSPVLRRRPPKRRD